MNLNLQELSDEELDALRVAVLTEQERRQIVATAAEQIVALQTGYLVALGRADGEPYVPPTGAHDAYPKGWKVQHDGKTWVSLTAANVWEPGVSGWREVIEEGGVPMWVQPTGAHDAYKKDDQVSHNGDTWTSTVDANTWEPGTTGSQWTKLD